MSINISICESDFYFKEILSQNIERIHSFNLNDCYNNGYDLINRLFYKQNDFLIINTFTPIMTGYEAIKFLRQKNNKTPIIAYSHVFQEDIFEQISQFPNTFYCQKNSSIIFDILTAITDNNRDFYISYLKKWKQNMNEVNDYIIRQQINTYIPSSIELKIIHYTCQGLTNKEVGEKVNLSSRTVENYIKKLTEKFLVKNKIQLITFCVEQSLHNYK